MRAILPMRNCEASEQKLGQEQKSELKEIELSYYHKSICILKKERQYW